ncbi:DEAD/DEAH box helicase family protein [Caldicellulosiruptor acetigenus]|uniref:DEAD/DEAH box helicase family protein n=1 Tax=Caldicellulosiruptor acetigenus TaxID=301953 RepID=UPI0001E9A77B|nr:DEAD/DEAH box helicase family protein [Caldicellulosiruptor acetigenus]
MKLAKSLVLYKFFLNLFGDKDLVENLKSKNEGYDTIGRSYFVDALISEVPNGEQKLLEYDQKIKRYTEHIGKGREYFSLKYFQYLAILFTEIFLERYFNDKNSFIAELNNFLENFNAKNRTTIFPFTEENLKKLAFWLATGSGKTLIMHINYLQMMSYCDKWDNILLITPSEEMSIQHHREMIKSGIPCKLYDGNIDSLKTKNKEVLIIDIYKLTEEKKGEGKTIETSYFDGKNLVFIDEGHKGQSTEE